MNFSPRKSSTRILSLSIFLSVIAVFSFRQASDINDLAQKIIIHFKESQEEFPIEKVFLHFDKPYYSAGEDVWFSAYLSVGSFQTPSPLSKLLYVDLLNEDGRLLEQKRLKIENGIGHGDLKLPLFMKEGNYRIRAYTNWMLNFGEEFLFQKDISILEPYLANFQPTVNWEIEKINEQTFQYSAKVLARNRNFAPISADLTARIKLKDQEIHRIQFNTNEDGIGEFGVRLSKNELEANPEMVLELPLDGEQPIRRPVALSFPVEVADIQFLPEGGSLVQGLPNRIALRAVLPNGQPLSVNGKIKNPAGEEIAEFVTNEMGLGSFLLLADEKNYNAHIYSDELTLAKIITFSSVERGVALQVDNSKPAQLMIQVASKGIGDAASPQEVLLVIHTRGQINHISKGVLDGRGFLSRVNKEDLLPGINHISLLNSAGIPLAERLIFTYPENAPSLKVDFERTDFSPRQKLNLNLQAEYSEGLPAGGRYSVSITDAYDTEAIDDDTDHIISSLLLSSDLKGKVHKPYHYFDRPDLEKKQALDLVMLTHGWRRFNWEDIVNQKEPEINHLIERGINLIGTITDLNGSSRRLKGGEVTTFVTGSEDDFIISTYDESGRFIVTELDFIDTTTIVIQASDGRFNRNVKIDIDAPLNQYEALSNVSVNPYRYQLSESLVRFLTSASSRTLANRLADQEKTIDLEGITVAATRITESENISRVYGKGDVVIVPGEKFPIGGANDIFSYIQGKIAGVQIGIGADGTAAVSIRGAAQSSFSGGGTPLVLLDNIPVQLNDLFTVPLNMVASIEVFKDPASTGIFGVTGANGVLAVYTKRGGALYEKSPGITTFNYSGYSLAREFYQPNYDKPEPSHSQGDTRSTIYWNPNLQVNSETGKAGISFFNNDISDRLRVSIQGWDAFGRPVYFSKVFEK